MEISSSIGIQGLDSPILSFGDLVFFGKFLNKKTTSRERLNPSPGMLSLKIQIKALEE